MAVKESKTGKKSKVTKRKTNLTKLYKLMNKATKDAVDSEVVKRFKILIDIAPEDITKTCLDTILNSHETLDISTIPETFQPYVKHYVFMVKRAAHKAQAKEA